MAHYRNEKSPNCQKNLNFCTTLSSLFSVSVQIWSTIRKIVIGWTDHICKQSSLIPIHHQTLHGYIQLMLTVIRSQYWIISAFLDQSLNMYFFEIVSKNETNNSVTNNEWFTIITGQWIITIYAHRTWLHQYNINPWAANGRGRKQIIWFALKQRRCIWMQSPL